MLLRSTHDQILADHQRRHNEEIRELRDQHDTQVAALRGFYENQIDFWRKAVDDQLAAQSLVLGRVLDKYMPVLPDLSAVAPRDPNAPWLYLESADETGLFGETVKNPKANDGSPDPDDAE